MFHVRSMASKMEAKARNTNWSYHSICRTWQIWRGIKCCSCVQACCNGCWQSYKDGTENVGMYMRVLRRDWFLLLQHLRKQLEWHIARCKEGREEHSHKLFQSSCGGDSLLPSLPAVMISMDLSCIHPAVLAEALLQQLPLIAATHCSIPKPIGSANL